jgi:hypothetical protein
MRALWVSVVRFEFRFGFGFGFGLGLGIRSNVEKSHGRGCNVEILHMKFWHDEATPVIRHFLAQSFETQNSRQLETRQKTSTPLK